MVDFLGIGVQKGGTTWLYHQLSRHPQIAFPGGKEVHFWDRADARLVGGTDDPPAISEAEVREIAHRMEEGAVKPKPKVLFESGEYVKVVDGPFQDFNGVVEEVKPDKGKLRVLISIFGRATPVELDFVQVEKA